MEEFIGVVLPYAGPRTPKYWLPCDGRLLDVQKYPALFSVIGATYGGDGLEKFALPDLRGLIAFGTGAGINLKPRSNGEKGGSEFVTITQQSMASHSHNSNASNSKADTDTPENSFLTITEKLRYCSITEAEGDKEVAMSTEIIGLSVGGTEPHANMPPYMVANYIICIEGIYPGQY